MFIQASTIFTSRRLRAIALLAITLLASSASTQAQPATNHVQQGRYQLLDSRDFPTQFFTQGLIKDGKQLIVSSGLYGHSHIAMVAIDKGAITQQKKLPATVFAEGITRFDDKLILLSWQSETAWQLHRQTLAIEKTWAFTGEGWGITHNQQQLIVSDGTAQLQFRDPHTFALTSTLAVTENNKPLTKLNELEFAQGKLWANIWLEQRIVAINVQTGKVELSIDLSDLTDDYHNQRTGSVLNGIAWDDEQQGFWISGKRWPKIFLIRIIQ